jgi:hypothetical protein
MTCLAPDLQANPGGSGSDRPIYPSGIRYTEMFSDTNSPPSVHSTDSPSIQCFDNPDVLGSSGATSPSHTPTLHPCPPSSTREWTPPIIREAADAVC